MRATTPFSTIPMFGNALVITPTAPTKPEPTTPVQPEKPTAPPFLPPTQDPPRLPQPHIDPERKIDTCFA